jgi:hypothetical protein
MPLSESDHAILTGTAQTLPAPGTTDSSLPSVSLQPLLAAASTSSVLPLPSSQPSASADPSSSYRSSDPLLVEPPTPMSSLLSRVPAASIPSSPTSSRFPTPVPTTPASSRAPSPPLPSYEESAAALPGTAAAPSETAAASSSQTAPLFPPSDSERGGDQDDDFGQPNPTLLPPTITRSKVVPLMMPPRMLQRLAWVDQDPRAALDSLETSPLHQPEANDSDDVADARTQNISMSMPTSGGNSHVAGDVIRVGADRKTVHAHGSNARGMALTPDGNTLAVMYFNNGEAHMDLSHFADADDEADSAKDLDSVSAATEVPTSHPRRSTRRNGSSAAATSASASRASTGATPSSATAPPSATASRALRSRGRSNLSTGRQASQQWRAMLTRVSAGQLANARLERLDAVFVTGAPVIKGSVSQWGCGIVSLLNTFLNFASQNFPDGALPNIRQRPAALGTWMASARRMTPAVYKLCDDAFGQDLKDWWTGMQPSARGADLGVIPTVVDWTALTISGTRGPCLLVAGLLLWRLNLDSNDRTTNDDLRPWIELVIDVNAVLGRILLDHAQASSDEALSGPSTVKRRKTASAVPATSAVGASSKRARRRPGARVGA